MASQKHRDFSRWASLAVSLSAFLTLNIATNAQNSSETTWPAVNASTLATPSVSVFHFADGGDDLPGRMTTDAAGNFYVAAELDSSLSASGFAVLKYRFNGTLQGTYRYKFAPGDFGGLAREVKVDKLGNIYAIGDTFVGGRVVSFTSNGSQRWTDRFSDSAIALAVDAVGNVYAAGTHVTGNFQSEWVIVKYSSGGRVLWQKRHTGTAHGDVRLADIQLDPAGNAVVVGTTNIFPSINGDTMTTMKLDSLGDILWVKDFVAGPSEHHLPLGLAVDRAGSVYVTGVPGANDTSTPPPPFTVKYDANGSRIFVLQAGGNSIAIDPAGDILLAGGSPSPAGPTAISASKFHPSGTKVWVTPIAAAQKIVSDAAGNVFVVGSVSNNDSTNPSDYLITKLSSAGKLQFQSRFNRGDDISDATMDPFGNLLVTGNALNAQFQHDIFTLRVK